jgi:hypothetical protein
VGDIAGVGSGVMLLAAAACFPEWAVRLHLVTFVGAEIDPLLVSVAKTNLMLYGLNGYSLRLAEAVQVAVDSQQQRAAAAGSVVPSKANGATPGQAIRACQPLAQSAPSLEGLTFESMFRAVAAPATSDMVLAPEKIQ